MVVLSIYIVVRTKGGSHGGVKIIEGHNNRNPKWDGYFLVVRIYLLGRRGSTICHEESPIRCYTSTRVGIRHFRQEHLETRSCNTVVC